MYNKYHDRGFTILAVNAWDDDAKTVREFAKEQNVPYPILLDGHRVSRDWGVKSIPANFFINREGEIVARSVGFEHDDVPQMEETIEKLLR